MRNTVETGWTARDTNTVKSFAVLHGGDERLSLDIKLEISNRKNETLVVNSDYILEPFGTLLIQPQDLSADVVKHLEVKEVT